MNPLKIAIPAAVLLALYLKKQAKKFTEDYKVQVHKIKFDGNRSEKTGFLKLFFPLELDVSNPTEVGAKVTGVNIELWYRKHSTQSHSTYSWNKIATVKNTSLNFAVKPKKTTRLHVNLEVPTLQSVEGLISAVMELMQGIPLEIKIIGEISFPVGSIKFVKGLALGQDDVITT